LAVDNVEVADVLGYRRPSVENDFKHLIDAVKAEVDYRKDVEPGSWKPLFADKTTLPQSRHIIVEIVNDDVVCFRRDSWLLEAFRGCSEASCLLTIDSVERASESRRNGLGEDKGKRICTALRIIANQRRHGYILVAFGISSLIKSP
jgi:hypothetical protein